MNRKFEYERCYNDNPEIVELLSINVYSYAYELGHSSGYGEVYNYLLDLVDIFE